MLPPIAERDRSTGAIKCIDYPHAEVHSGSAYTIANTISIAAAATASFILETPNTTKWAHLTFQATALSGPATFELYEGVSANADGTLATPINNNRNSTKTSGLVVRLNPTGISGGSLLSKAQTGSAGSGFFSTGLSGGMISRDSEYILKQNTKYEIRITNDHTDPQVFSYQNNWYEHTNDPGASY